MDIKEFLKIKHLEEALAERFAELTRLTLEWNEKINVTAIRDPEEFMQKNIIDSLTLIGSEELASAQTVLDLGTGGGYPGIPLAMCFPEKQFLLMDAVGKKLKVVDAVCEALGVRNVKTVHLRAEDMAKDKQYRESFDLVVSRAVANMSTLSEYCLPFVKVGGSFIAYKTADAGEEIAAAAAALDLLGSAPAEILPDGIAGSGHNFVICRKIRKTPAGYPRRAGLPKEKPL